MSQAKRLSIENQRLHTECRDLATVLAFIAYSKFDGNLELDTKEMEKMPQKIFNINNVDGKIVINLTEK